MRRAAILAYGTTVWRVRVLRGDRLAREDDDAGRGLTRDQALDAIEAAADAGEYAIAFEIGYRYGIGVCSWCCYASEIRDHSSCGIHLILKSVFERDVQ